MLQRLLEAGLEKLAPIERLNLVNDAWATTVAGLMPLSAYLDLTGRFALERDKNVWAVLIDSFAFLNRIIEPADRALTGVLCPLQSRSRGRCRRRLDNTAR